MGEKFGVRDESLPGDSRHARPPVSKCPAACVKDQLCRSRSLWALASSGSNSRGEGGACIIVGSINATRLLPQLGTTFSISLLLYRDCPGLPSCAGGHIQ